MKRIKLLCVLLSLLLFIACNNDEIEPISLHYVVNNSIEVVYPGAAAYSISIIGGDGHYSVSCDDISIVEVSLVPEKKMILLEPISIGEATVTIADQSENSYVLNVKVGYSELNLIIAQQDVVVVGDNLSDAQRTDIQQKAALTFPVKVSGGFKLVYNNVEEPTKGEAYIYKDNFGGMSTRSAFEFKTVEIDVDGAPQNQNILVVTIDGKQREFVAAKYVAPRSSMQVALMSINDVLTEQFKADYPEVTLVYTQQLLKPGS